MPQRLQDWLYSRQLPDFAHFHFIESRSFEPIAQNYWKVVHEPVGQQEVALFCQKKLEACLSVLVTISSCAGLEQYLT